MNLLAQAVVALQGCDEEWFAAILASNSFQEYLGGGINRAATDPIELAKLALAESFLPHANLTRAFEVVLRDSNPYAAAALYACLEGYIGDPGAYRRPFERFAETQHPGEAPELEAAFFAHIKDQRSYVWGLNSEFPLLPAKNEENLYARFAQKMLTRTRAYMYLEWKRLSQFQRNLEAKSAATQALQSISSSREAEQFAELVTEIRGLHDRAASKSFVVLHGTTENLPAPYEDLRMQLGRTAPPAVPLLLLDGMNNVIIKQDCLREGAMLRLPPKDHREYVLIFSRLGNLPYQSDNCSFVVVPLHVWRWVEQTKGDSESIELRPNPHLFDPAHLAQFVGTYGRDWLTTVKINLRGKVLTAQWCSHQPFDLVPYDGDAFSFGGTASGTIRFEKKADGTIAAFWKGKVGTAIELQRQAD